MPRLLYIGNKLSAFGSTPTSVEYLGNLLERNQYQVMYAGDKKNKIIRMLNIVKMLVFHRSQYDLILIDVYSTLAFYFAMIGAFIARILNKPYIPILHGGDLPARFAKSPSMIKSLLNQAQVVVSPSNFLYHYFKDAGFSRLHWIANPISVVNYPFMERGKIRPNLLWLRSFHTIYNPVMAIHVLKKVIMKYPSAKLVMIGPDKDGIALDECKKWVDEYEMADHISILGKLSKQEWIDISSSCDIFINTTNFDNAPVSVIEAMALGFAVVSTNVGGIPFLVKDGHDALLVNANDVDAMIEKIEYLLSNPEITKMISCNARASAMEFDDELVIKKWNQVLKQTLN